MNAENAIWLGILALAVIGTPTFTVLVMVANLTGPKPLVRRLPDGHPKFRKLPADIAQFAAAHGLTLTEVLQYGNIPFGIYREPPGPPPDRCMVVMLSGDKYVSEFCTDFSPTESLTTTRGNHAFVHPRPPGSHIQGFLNLSLEQLWARHLEGELFLVDHRQLRPAPLPAQWQDAVVRIEHGLRRQGAHVKATPLFWLKAPWWFFVKRHGMTNRTIAQQLTAAAGGAA